MHTTGLSILRDILALKRWSNLRSGRRGSTFLRTLLQYLLCICFTYTLYCTPINNILLKSTAPIILFEINKSILRTVVIRTTATQ